MFFVYKQVAPTVSIIMPTYNRAEYLARSIESVIRQTEKQWELLVIDDGSTDDTFDIIRRYSADYDHIRYMWHSNRRPALSLNAGFAASVGKYATILCSDDEYLPHHIESRLHYMNANPGVDFIYGGVEIVGDPYVVDVTDSTKKIHLSQCAIGGTFFAKRDVLDALGGFRRIGFGGDADLLRRVQEKYSVQKVDFPTYRYFTETPGNLTSSVKSRVQEKNGDKTP